MLKHITKSWLRSSLRRRGYELKEIGAPLRGYVACLEYAKSRGLAPSTVFDVGVGHGTPWLYSAFPGAKLVLFEPLSVFDEDLERIALQHGADVHRVALGKEVGEARMLVHTAHPTSSSLLERNERFTELRALSQPTPEFAQRAVPIETLDRLASSYAPPFVIKLDVEGMEREVLEGSRAVLQQTDFLIAEISILRRRHGDPGFAQMISFLDSLEFELFDIPSIAQTSNGGQPVYLDAAFVRKGSSLWP